MGEELGRRSEQGLSGSEDTDRPFGPAATVGLLVMTFAVFLLCGWAYYSLELSSAARP